MTAEQIRRMEDGLPADVRWFVDALLDWGAAGVIAVSRGGYDAVDFKPPFPGDQPISSGVEIRDGGVGQATIRYGVLDESQYVTHPSGDSREIGRIKAAIGRGNPPAGWTVLGNYGDPHHPPRPHMLCNWRPSMAEDVEVVQEAPPRGVSIRQFEPFMRRVGQAVRREFRGEWDG